MKERVTGVASGIIIRILEDSLRARGRNRAFARLRPEAESLNPQWRETRVRWPGPRTSNHHDDSGSSGYEHDLCHAPSRFELPGLEIRNEDANGRLRRCCHGAEHRSDPQLS